MEQIASRLIYKLKHSWGVPVTLYRVSEGTPNRETGEFSIVRTKTEIRKAVLIPIDVRYATFTQSEFKIGDRELIIDAKDLPILTLSSKDYFTYRTNRYNIVSYTYIDDVGHYFHLRQTQSQLPHRQVSVTMDEGIIQQEETTGE